jgi:hypothetical protein
VVVQMDGAAIPQFPRSVKCSRHEAQASQDKVHLLRGPVVLETIHSDITRVCIQTHCSYTLRMPLLWSTEKKAFPESFSKIKRVGLLDLLT